MTLRHLMQSPAASLGQNHGSGRLDERQVRGIGLASGTNYIFVCRK
jgi:hypothetical protein